MSAGNGGRQFPCCINDPIGIGDCWYWDCLVIEAERGSDAFAASIFHEYFDALVVFGGV